ncbi:MAG TPA: ethylbenzene dehydrogenase-related protein, partial [Pelomicrobium sp.]|nr:ethylbenzene dehydrogenase-related protein [Pelomicrobium sp.]
DDQYLDHQRWSEKNPGAGRHSDPKTGGGYENIKIKNGVPEFMNKNAKPANRGGTYWLKKEDAVAMDASKFKAGDDVAAIMISAFSGDRGDITAASKWANGKWTMELSRKLTTGSKYDVQFDNLDAGYHFGVAAFNNAQVRHAVHYDLLTLKFAK